MTNWFAFLEAQGASLTQGEYPEVISFGETPSQYPQLQSQTLLFSLDDRGILGFSGPDTDKLLQGQVTCDIHQLSEQQALRGALCTIQGRMVSDFHLCRPNESETLLVSHLGLVTTTLETLKKFAVFYKTVLVDQSASYRVLGLTGPDARALAQQATGADDSDSNCLQGNGVCMIKVAAQRWLVIVPTESAQALWHQFGEKATAAGLPLWRLLAIADGDGEVHPSTAEEFIPQMLNLQLTGAVSFKKGCYTGQEIVARMQYLGKLKRRMYRLAFAGPSPQPGAPLHQPGGRECGTVVMAAPSGEECSELLAVLTDEAAAAGVLCLDSDEFAVRKLPLPYEAVPGDQQEGS